VGAGAPPGEGALGSACHPLGGAVARGHPLRCGGGARLRLGGGEGFSFLDV